MQPPQKPKASPLQILKIFLLSLSMLVGFGAAFYAGYHGLPYILGPAILLEVSCSACLSLHSRYLRGILFLTYDEFKLKASVWAGWVLLVLSVAGCLGFAITGFGKMEGFEYEDYGLTVSLVPCVMSVVWSVVLVLDSRHYLEMWQREVGNAMGGRQMVFSI